MRRSESKDPARGLSEERKALAQRYTGAATDAPRPEPATPTEDPEQQPPRRTSPLAGPLARLRRQLAPPDHSESTLPADLYDRLRNLGGENGRLRCPGCGREGARGEDGWTLQLCGDDQLHTFCRECYEREFAQVD